MQKWPFFNKPKVQPEQKKLEQLMPETPQQTAPASMPAAQQKPNQQAMPNTMTMPAAQQKPNQQAMPNTMTMPAAQQKPNQQAMPNTMTMPAMTLPTVPAPKDNAMYMSPVKSMKAGNMNNMMGQHMENNHMMGQHMKDQDLSDEAYTQVSMAEALELIKSAVEGETEDRMFYSYLIDNAANSKDREIIKGIRDDEIKHAKMFRQLYYELTGKVIGPKQDVSFEKPASYCEGLIRALMGEQNAVRKYRKILFAMKERRHINALTEIITDEIRHGSLYNLMVHNNDCKY